VIHGLFGWRRLPRSREWSFESIRVLSVCGVQDALNKLSGIY